jgi:hypothetical protein
MYWKAEMLSFDIVPNAEADRAIARYRKKGYHAEVYSKELIVTIAKKNLSKSLQI